MQLFKISLTNWFKIMILGFVIIILIIFGYFTFFKKSIRVSNIFPDDFTSKQNIVKNVKKIIEKNMNRFIDGNEKKEKYRFKTSKIKNNMTGEESSIKDKSYLDYKTFNITLFFSDENAENLIGESREIKVSSNNIVSLTRGILIELIKGPETKKLYPVINQKTTIRAIYYHHGCIYIDFHKNINDNKHMGSTGELLLLYSIVNTLTQFQEIRFVRFLIDGKEKKSFETRHLSLDENISKNENINVNR
ncbi:GerMN domain-containing protein [bacterium]|nr:GerMN domain-containing protein [bacterium]